MRATDGALLIVALAITWSLYRAHRSTAYSFDFFDLLMDNGRLSRLAFVFMGSFLVSSWIMIRLTFDGKMTEGLFMAYGTVWVAPIIARLFSPPQTVSVTTTASSSQTVTAP